MMRETEYKLPLGPTRRLLTRGGAERSSDDAVVELRNVLEEVGYNVSAWALEYAKHAGRMTIKPQDIKLALKMRYGIDRGNRLIF